MMLGTTNIKYDFQLRNVCSYFLPSVRTEQLGSNWPDSNENRHCIIFFHNLSRKFKFYLHWTRITIFYVKTYVLPRSYLAQVFLEREIFQIIIL